MSPPRWLLLTPLTVLIATATVSAEVIRPDIPIPFVMGAYKDQDEFFPMQGRIKRIRIHDTALTPAEVDGTAHGLAVAGGGLFVSTNRGTIHAFGP